MFIFLLFQEKTRYLWLAYNVSVRARELESRVLSADRKGSDEGIALLHENEAKVTKLEASRGDIELEREKAAVKNHFDLICYDRHADVDCCRSLIS